MKYSSLKFKLFISIGAACLLIVLFASFFQLFQMRELEKDRIHEEFANFEIGAKQTIREAVWRYDWDMVKSIVESQTSKALSFVEVCDNKVDKCLTHGSRNLYPFIDYTARILYQKAADEKKVEIGTIHLQGHYPTVGSYIYHELPKIVLTNSASVFCIAMVLVALFHRQVVQRLLALGDRTQRIDLKHIESLDLQEERNIKKVSDEIDQLADAVDGLIMKIKEEFDRRKVLEQRLNQAQKMEALGTLAGGIAHDFNNILAAIIGFAELSYLKSEPGSEIHRNLEKVISAGQRARNLTSQILVFSRRMEIPQEILVFAAVIEEALHLFRTSLPANIVIEKNFDTEVKVKGDSTQLHQVIMNLVKNGVQAIGEQGGRVSMTLESIDLDRLMADRLDLDPGSYCCFKISDDGCGIPAGEQSRVLEPFFTTKKAGEGTGMGLAVVHGIVKNHGGAIQLESAEGVGTSFYVYIPRTEQEIKKDKGFTGISTGSGQHIVLVDDEPQVLEMGRAILENLGYETVIFLEPQAALKYMQNRTKAGLLITDFTMPDMNGVELAREVKKYHPDIPILLWTGHREDMVMKSLESRLIDRILQKPFRIEDLAHIVKELCDHKD